MKKQLPQKTVMKISSTLASLFLILNLVSPTAAYAFEEIEELQTEDFEEQDSQEEEPYEEVEVPEADMPTETDSTWEKQLDGSFVTVEPLVLEKEYIVEDLNNLKVIFTSLPEDSGKLYVKEVPAPEEVDGEEVVGRAYSIESDMQNGTFTYDLYLPKPEEVQEDNLQVKYSEDGEIFHDISGEIVQSNYIVVKGLDHFTYFIITDDDTTQTGGTWIDYPTQGYLNTGVHYPQFSAAGGIATWDFSTITDGGYQVYISWSTHPNRTTVAPYTLNYNGGSTNLTINQELLADQTTIGASGQWSGWYYVGTYDLTTASNMILTSVDNTSWTEYVIADEVLLQQDPVPTITFPAHDSYLRTVDLTHIDWTNSTGMFAPYEYQYQAFSDANYTINRWGPSGWLVASQIPTLGTPEDEYYVRVRARGSNDVMSAWSNGASDPYKITVDNTPPVVQITNPLDGDIVQSNINITGNIIEDNLSHYNLSLYAGWNYNDTWNFANRLWQIGGSTNSVSHNLDTAGFGDGQYMIRLAARDLVGNRDPMPNSGTGVSVHVIYITIDNTPPFVAWNNPLNGDPLRGTVTLEATCDGGATEAQYVNFWWWKASEGQTVVGPNSARENHQYHYVRRGNLSTGTVVGNTFSWNLDTTNDSLKSPSYDWEGEWRFRAACKDAAGNYSHAEINVIVDNTPPVSEVYLQGDLDETKNIVGDSGWHGYGWYESYDNVNLRISSGDTVNDFIHYQILSGDVVCPTQGDAGYSPVSHDTNVNGDVNGTDGLYTLCYYAEDLAGNTESSTHKQLLHVDDTNPEYTIDYSSISGNEVSGVYYINSDTINVDVNVTDNLSGYTRARYDLYTADASWNCTHDHANQDNLLPPSVSTTRTFTESGLADGWYCLRIWVYDDVQNKAWTDTNGQGWVHFVIDTERPIIDGLDDKTYDEGEWVNLGFLNDKGMSDNTGLNEAFVYITYTDLNNIEHVLVDTTIDISDAGGDGLGGTLNELYEYYVGVPIDFSTIEVPVYTYIISEGVYTFDYYVTDMAENRSDCYEGVEGENNCHFTITVKNVPPQVDLSMDSPVPVYEGDTANFLASFDDPSYIDFGRFVFPEIGELTNFTNLTNLNTIPEGSFPADDQNWSVEIDYDEGAGFEFLGDMTVPGDINAVFGPLQETYENSRTYTVRVRVCEEDPEVSENDFFGNPLSEGECGMATLTLLVLNVAPTVTISADPGTSVANGTSVTLTANPVGGNVPLTYNWSGDCSGSSQTTTVPSTPGTYNCTVTVTDADLDTATSSITVTVNPLDGGAGAAVAGATTTRGLVAGAQAADGGEGEEDSDQEEEKEEAVLGEATCENPSKVSGYIYYDNNDNHQKDDDEEGLQDIIVSIYSVIDEEEKFVTTAKTDENGYWETELCAGNYKAKVDKEDLPENTEIAEEELSLSVEENKDTGEVNFKIKKVSSKFNWLWCLIPLLILFLLVTLFILLSRKEEKKYGGLA